MSEIDFGEVNLRCIVKAVKFEELSNELSAYHTRCSLHNLFRVGVLPVKARLTLLYLVLIVDDLEYARAELRSQLTKDAVGLKGLDD